MYAVALSVWSPGETTQVWLHFDLAACLANSCRAFYSQWARYAAVYVVSPTLGAALATTVWAVGLKMYEEYYPYVLHILRNNSEKEKIS